MTDATVPDRAAGVGRLGTAAAWISAVCCLPYLVLKVVWTVGIPVGVTDRSVLHGHGWAAANAVMAAIELAGLLLVLALTRPWARRLPAWLLLFPVWVGTGLLFRVVVGAALAGLSPSLSQASSGSLGGIQARVLCRIQRIGGKLELGRRPEHCRHLAGVVGGGDQQCRLRRAGELPGSLPEHAF